MRHPEERSVLSRAATSAQWRLARWLGLTDTECHCAVCRHQIVEWLAREMVRVGGERARLSRRGCARQ